MKMPGTPCLSIHQLPHNFPDLDRAVEAFASRALPPLEKLTAEEPICGWVTGRHPMDREITPEHALCGGYLRLSLTQAERWVCAKRLSAEIESKCAKDRVESAAMRRDIAHDLRRALLNQADYRLRSLTCVFDYRASIGGVVYTDAGSPNQQAAVEFALLEAAGCMTVRETATVLARQAGVDHDQLEIAHFTEASRDVDVLDHLGADFLTWLLFASEAYGGMVELPGDREVAFMLEGPLRFVSRGQGAHAVDLKHGPVPSISAEAKAALVAGKKLTKALVSFADCHGVKHRFAFDALPWVFRAFKSPEEPEIKTDAARLQERMNHLADFRADWNALFRHFLEIRNDLKRWDTEIQNIDRWANSRRAAA